ncbi:alpha-L-fucosidase [Opitutaceae bacterium EW11]|nr:alpha-L-fucosidase [Opitutaceae bacterium EW11]
MKFKLASLCLTSALALACGTFRLGAAAPGANPARKLAPGPYQPNWDSLTNNYRTPEWFRDAKFGIWAHWSAQCVPEQGDWYARNMYQQGERQYEYHVKHYGHPSKFGFMELDNLWKAERWDPEKLMELYQRAGARYFVALANHHDNFDNYNSKYHEWNSVRVGPKKDLIGIWAKTARAHGLRFGVSNHSAHAWHWFQTAYGYDAEGPMAGVRYDAATLTKADGVGKWWEGLDPQKLYTGPNIKMPDGLKTIQEQRAWHEANDRVWNENPPAMNPEFTDTWFLRCQDLIDSYHPDLIYFDNTELPLGQAGLDITAHYYNANLKWHGGKLEGVINAKKMTPGHAHAVVPDIERGVATGIQPDAWQTDTCIGSWHYERRLFTEHKYKTVGQVVRMLVDIVSKNGNLLLSVPIRGDGTIDEDEIAFLQGMARWMNVNSEGIYATRPWSTYGEGPSTTEQHEAGHFGGARDVRSKPYTAEDIRFTKKGDSLYAFVLAWPEDRTVVIHSLGQGASTAAGHTIEEVRLLGVAEPLKFEQDASGLKIHLPEKAPSEHAVALKIRSAKAW